MTIKRIRSWRYWIAPALLGVVVGVAAAFGSDGCDILVVVLVAFLIGYIDGDTDSFTSWGRS